MADMAAVTILSVTATAMGYGSRYGCADPYWGWHGGYYYPGTGYYVYDRYRRPFRWTDAQRRYWTERRERAQTVPEPQQNQTLRPNWSDFTREQTERRAARIEHRDARREQIQTRVEDRRAQSSTRSSARQSASERRSERRTERENRRNSRRDD
jgi:hypothetical protein